MVSTLHVRKLISNIKMLHICNQKYKALLNYILTFWYFCPETLRTCIPVQDLNYKSDIVTSIKLVYRLVLLSYTFPVYRLVLLSVIHISRSSPDTNNPVIYKVFFSSI